MERAYFHVLVTRFNVDIAYAASGRGIEDDWLRDRIQVFDRITVPSVVSQSVPFDAWLVFFNSRSPQWFKTLVEARTEFTPIWIEGPLLDGRISSELRGLGWADREFLITSRLDNDDAISRDFAAAVQHQFDRQDRLFIEFPRGVEYANGDYFRKTWRSNPFLSLIEGTRGAIDTVIVRPHPEVRRAEPTRTLWDRNMWLQNSHPLSTTSPRVRNARPIIRKGRPRNIVCEWRDDGGSLPRRLLIGVQSAPLEVARKVYRALRRID
jgi:hypothetical protein